MADSRALQGASPGLGGIRLRGGEALRATHVHPTSQEWVMTIPREQPRMSLKPPGCPYMEVEPELLSVRVDLRAGLMVCTWSGSQEIAARYPDDEFAQIQSRVQFVS